MELSTTSSLVSYGLSSLAAPQVDGMAVEPNNSSLLSTHASFCVYSVPELLCMIVKECDYTSLINFAAASDHARETVDYSTDAMILGSLPLLMSGLYIPDDHILMIAVPLLYDAAWHFWTTTFDGIAVSWGQGLPVRLLA
ncbi:hypothetical protein K435DRAFT_850775 [Dendrothele bispora CBS 962.96]|uniref:Uncharacterized protein n=1 Tax=Dendrothele bispora (strain CBS 962.96) TaxID=1314807 RepID=A0A4S8MNH5_DENBC|nr:hypothetical protein K435DRAFT_850775 [Dendrothele bispora CBS 962.96]